jgi:aquaporin Z
VLLAVGLSAVTVDFAGASPVPGWIPDPLVRRFLTGSVFAGTGTVIVYSMLGRISGAHLNPAMTVAFLGLGKVEPRMAAGYIGAQITGAVVGAGLVRLAWGGLATSVMVGATIPGTPGPLAAFVAEAALTFLLVTLILRLMRHPQLRRFTGVAAGMLVVLIVTVEAPISGASLNPARSLGPALVAGVFNSLWVYLAGPLVGAAAAAWLSLRAGAAVPCAKLWHTDEFACHFPDCAYSERRRGPGANGPDDNHHLGKEETQP